MASMQNNIQSTAKKAEHSVNSASDLIQEGIGKENFDTLLGMLQPIGDFSIKAFRTTANYARRHPVRIAVSVLAVGVLSSWLAKSKAKELLH